MAQFRIDRAERRDRFIFMPLSRSHFVANPNAKRMVTCLCQSGNRYAQMKLTVIRERKGIIRCGRGR